LPYLVLLPGVLVFELLASALLFVAGGFTFTAGAVKQLGAETLGLKLDLKQTDLFLDT